MSDPWEMTAGNGWVPHETIDWRLIKSEILTRLDLIEEFRALGLRFSGEPNPETAKIQAQAMGRQDRNPSAFVNLKSGIYHACGDPPETLGFFDFAMRYGEFGDWSEMIRTYAEKTRCEVPKYRKSSRGWIEEAVYHYTDKGGAVLFEVVRYRQPNGRKTFRQRRPDPKGGWQYNLDGVIRVLYRLPELVARPDDTLYFVEGEKDADALGTMGFLTTTSAQGADAAGRRYWEDGLYQAELAGRTVVVLPDNDSIGRSFGRLVASKALEVGARVKVLLLPDLPHKGDVSDWLEMGGKATDLLRLVDETADWSPESEPPELDPNRDATAADLIAANAGTRWLWEGWIPLSVLTLLTAEPSTGKTRFALDLAKRIAHLSSWPDGTAISLPDNITNRVLFVAADSQHSELADAPKAYGFPAEAIVLNTTVSDLYGGTELMTAEQLADLEARIRRLQPALVIIDTITNTSDLKSQDTSDAKRQYKPLQEIAKKTGAALLCVTHLNVAGKTLGRRADEKTRVTIRLEKLDDGQPNRRKLSVALSRLSMYPSPLGVTMGDDGNQYDTSPPEAQKAAAPSERIQPLSVQQAIGFLTARLSLGPARVSQIRSEAEQREPSISPRALYRAKDFLEIDEYEEQGRKWWRFRSRVHIHEEDAWDVWE